ncbi:hypothetical protein ACWD4O_29650 [Streptomyces sp. NPDC002623]
MTEEQPRAWVGDQVYDAEVSKEGVITDTQGGVAHLLGSSGGAKTA